MRHRLLGLAISASALGGSLAAHALGAIHAAGPVGTLDPDGGHEATSALHGSSAIPTIVAVAVTMILAVLVMRVIAGRHRVVVAVLAPFVTFAVQEWLERRAAVESSPFGVGHEPTILLAIVALATAAIGAVALLRVLTRVASRIVRQLAAAAAIAHVAGGGIAWRLLPDRPPTPGIDILLERPPRAPPLVLA